MPHTIEHASSGRAKCRGCGQAVPKDALRLGERLPNPFADEGGEMTHWYHVACAAYRRPEAFLEAIESVPGEIAAAIEDRDHLRHEAGLGIAHRRLSRVSGAARAPSGRATCRSCRETIPKDSWRIALQYYEDGRWVPSGSIHMRCAAAYLETTEILARLKHAAPNLGEADLAEIENEIRQV
jgi:hypothetical protein